jgi:DNA-binding LacI/PurR family transcriptional regulator
MSGLSIMAERADAEEQPVNLSQWHYACSIDEYIALQRRPFEIAPNDDRGLRMSYSLLTALGHENPFQLVARPGTDEDQVQRVYDINEAMREQGRSFRFGPAYEEEGLHHASPVDTAIRMIELCVLGLYTRVTAGDSYQSEKLRAITLDVALKQMEFGD